MNNEELADLIVARTTNLQSHFDMKLTAMQSHIYGKLLSIESTMASVRPESVWERETEPQTMKALD